MSAALLVLPDRLIMIFSSLLKRKIGFSREFFFAAAAVVACGIVLSWLAWPIQRARRQLTDFNRHPAFGTYATHLAIAHLLRPHDSTHTHP